MSKHAHDELSIIIEGVTCRVTCRIEERDHPRPDLVYMYASVHQDISLAVAHWIMLNKELKIFLYTPTTRTDHECK